MEKHVLKNIASLLLPVLLFMVSCISLNVNKEPIKQRSYCTILPSGKVLSITFRTDSTFEETNCVGRFQGKFLCQDSLGNPKKYANSEGGLFILCQSNYIDSLDLLDEDNMYCLSYKYLPISHDDEKPIVKLYDRDEHELEIFYLCFYGKDNELLYYYSRYSNHSSVFNNQIPKATKRIVIAGEGIGGSIGGCNYNDSFVNVNFYLIPNYSKSSYWLKNPDSLYYIPYDVKDGDTANYLYLRRVK
ncbi:MAG: hypothetical protein IJ057_12420 [Bacteroidales bacterium]|nr:hypothetical protein [Bacteroidales bacterium]